MSRLTIAAVLELGESLPPQERLMLQTIERFGLLGHDQLATLLTIEVGVATASSQARMVRRRLAALTDAGLLARLDRRIGGVRAGSRGFVYYLGPVGQRLLAYWRGDGLTRGRVRPEPGSRFVAHRLAVSELFIRLRGLEAQGTELLAFDPEPDCWRTFAGGLGATRILKPDAFVRMAVGAYEDRYFVEVDLGSESRTVIAQKLRTYISYYQSGSEQAMAGVFPRVLWLTNSEARKELLVTVLGRVPAETWRLFQVAMLDQAADVFVGEQADTDAAGLGGSA